MDIIQSTNKFIDGLIGALDIVHSHINNVLYFDFIDPPQNHYLFYQSPANIMHILEITSKEIVYIARYQSWEKQNKFYQLDVKLAWVHQWAMK